MRGERVAFIAVRTASAAQWGAALRASVGPRHIPSHRTTRTLNDEDPRRGRGRDGPVLPARQRPGPALRRREDARLRRGPAPDARRPPPRDGRLHPPAPRRRLHRGAPRLPRAAQLLPRPGQGRRALQPGRGPGRGPRAGHVDDLEVRPAGRALRRRQGRGDHRPAPVLEGRARARHPPLHLRDPADHRPRGGHPRPGRGHGRADHGLDDGHLLGERRPHHARRGHRQARLARRLAGPRLRHLGGRGPRGARRARAPRHRAVAGDGGGPGLRQGRRRHGRAARGGRREGRGRVGPVRRRARRRGPALRRPAEAALGHRLREGHPRHRVHGRGRAARDGRGPRGPGRRAVRADRGERPARARPAGGGGRQRPHHGRGRPHPRGEGRPGRPGHPGQRRRRDRLLLRVGPGEPGLLVEP